ncbi:Fic family protein [[Flexibacter] sp. ATCC 35208]|uniref:Fic family protein n=1 Tax=[Flexibacter] sp. ATCC 35208 TaxID=1936242 RepID=UPI0021006CB2|nr:Fic/DOC family N-terminal domain-containing protein [[Flexibacter] sp. ATCC 35208]
MKRVGKYLPNPNILLYAVILKEASVSSEIENVITTQDKLYQALSADTSLIDPATKELLRYREEVLYGFNFIRQKGFLNTNSIVSIQQKLEENNAGIRKLPGTALRNGAIGEVIYTSPDDYDTILNLMKNLEEYLNDKDDLSPLIKLAVQHYQFESIHPFYNGNGRTGRPKRDRFYQTTKAVEKVVYLSLMQAQKKWTMPQREWPNMLLQFINSFGQERCNLFKSKNDSLHS